MREVLTPPNRLAEDAVKGSGPSLEAILKAVDTGIATLQQDYESELLVELKRLGEIFRRLEPGKRCGTRRDNRRAIPGRPRHEGLGREFRLSPAHACGELALSRDRRPREPRRGARRSGGLSCRRHEGHHCWQGQRRRWSTGTRPAQEPRGPDREILERTERRKPARRLSPLQDWAESPPPLDKVAASATTRTASSSSRPRTAVVCRGQAWRSSPAPRATGSETTSCAPNSLVKPSEAAGGVDRVADRRPGSAPRHSPSRRRSPGRRGCRCRCAAVDRGRRPERR